MPLATSSYGASKNGLMPIPVCGMKPMECTTPSSLLPSPITSVTRPASESRCSWFCTSSSSSGAGWGSRSAMRWMSFIRSNPVRTSSAPDSCATLAMWNAIDESVMIPVTRMRLPSRIAVIVLTPVRGRCEARGFGSVAHTHAAVDGDHRTGDVTRVLRRKEAHHPCHLCRGADPLRRDYLQRVFLDPLVQPAGHVCVDVTRRHHFFGDPGL